MITQAQHNAMHLSMMSMHCHPIGDVCRALNPPQPMRCYALVVWQEGKDEPAEPEPILSAAEIRMQRPAANDSTPDNEPEAA